MQNVSTTELARRLCETEHPRVPSVRSPGGTPCARHVRDASEFQRVMNDPNVVDVLVKAAHDQNGHTPSLMSEAVMEAWGIIANAGGGDWSIQTEEWQQAAARWRDHWLGAAPTDGAGDSAEGIGGEPV